jgi:RNA polymerase sigma-70 factor, ECF subfamily
MQDPQTELSALVAQIQQGHHQALAELFDATQGKLLALIGKIVRIHADAEDVLISVFQQVWERPMRYSAERGSVMAWLYVIARSRALDHIRRSQSSALRDGSSAIQNNDPEHSTDDLLQSIQESSALHAAITELKPEQRKMLELAFFQSMSHDDIATLTGLPLGTVKSHIRRGQQAMRSHLIACGVSR